MLLAGFRAGFRPALLELARWSVLLSFAALPFAKPAINIFLFLGLLLSLAGPDLFGRVRAALSERVVQGTLLWFAVMVASTLHATQNPDRWSDFGVYKALAYPFVIATVLTTTAWRNRAMGAFAAAAFIILLMSWAQLFGVEAPNDLVEAFEAYRYTVFNDYSQQGLQFLMLAALCTTFAPQCERPRWRFGLYVIAFFSVANVLLLLQSRTAYLATAPLLLYWSWRFLAARIGAARSLVAGIVLLAVVAGVAAFTPRVQERMHAAKQDISQYVDRREATSLGIRLELWQRTLRIVKEAPLFGQGTGGWLVAFQAQTAGEQNFDQFRMRHPHHETLLILAEEGIVGLALFAALIIGLGRLILRAPLPQRDFFASLYLIYLAAGLANSMLIDFVNRHGFLMLLACFPLLLPRKAAP